MENEPPSPTDHRRAALKVKEQEALDIIKKDICEWMTNVVGQTVELNNFWDALDTGIVVCQLAKQIQVRARNSKNIPMEEVLYNKKAEHGSFQARDNAANFINWCRKLGVPGTVMFESNGLVMHTDDRGVVLCLLEVGRHASKVDMIAPQLVQLEEEIDATEAAEDQQEEREGGDAEARATPSPTNIALPVKAQLSPRSPTATKTPQKATKTPQKATKTPQKATASLEKQVLDILQQCTCKDKITVCSSKNAKFALLISNKRYTLFARVLSDRIMVRVGGGWDTLDHFLLMHDPCRGMSILLSTKAALRNSDVKGVASLHAITSPKLPSSVDETDGQEVEKIQTVLAPPTQTALAPPPAVNSSIIRTAAVIFMVQAFLFCVYFYGLRTPALIGAVVVLVLIAYRYAQENTPTQAQLAKKEN